ncbi:hypothetical protein SLE2022_300000 [Rubroshorea leprosula]
MEMSFYCSKHEAMIAALVSSSNLGLCVIRERGGGVHAAESSELLATWNLIGGIMRFHMGINQWQDGMGDREWHQALTIIAH